MKTWANVWIFFPNGRMAMFFKELGSELEILVAAYVGFY